MNAEYINILKKREKLLKKQNNKAKKIMAEKIRKSMISRYYLNNFNTEKKLIKIDFSNVKDKKYISMNYSLIG